MTYLGDIKESLSDFKITKSQLKGKEEGVITKMIIKHLKEKGLKVTHERQVGFLKFYVDIDCYDGKACVEVKLTSKLINTSGNTSEIQRLFGQVYYYVQNYKNVVPVVMALVVGEASLENDPRLADVKKYIERMGAKYMYLPTKG